MLTNFNIFNYYRAFYFLLLTLSYYLYGLASFKVSLLIYHLHT